MPCNEPSIKSFWHLSCLLLLFDLFQSLEVGFVWICTVLLDDEENPWSSWQPTAFWRSSDQYIAAGRALACCRVALPRGTVGSEIEDKDEMMSSTAQGGGSFKNRNPIIGGWFAGPSAMAKRSNDKPKSGWNWIG